MREAASRFRVSVLNYAVTSNHVHVIMVNDGEDNSIAEAMHLVSGRTGQEYNDRKRRLGAYWEDRYHATAVESGTHLINCMAYIDTNMVRAHVVEHPREWPYCGYQEISGRRKRYRLICQERFALCVGMDFHSFSERYDALIEAYVGEKHYEREGKWTDNLAVGSMDFVTQMKLELGVKARSRVIMEQEDSHTLEEQRAPYGRKKGPGISSKAIF
jgi:putative transposase